MDESVQCSVSRETWMKEKEKVRGKEVGREGKGMGLGGEVWEMVGDIILISL